MRTAGFGRDGPPSATDTCLFCTASPRRVRQSIYKIGSVFALTITAFLIASFLEDKNWTGDSVGQGSGLRHRIQTMDDQLSIVSTELEEVQGLLKSCRQETPNAERIVKDLLAKYDADKTGRADFALASLGSCIASVRDTKPYSDGGADVTFLGFTVSRSLSKPHVILQPSIRPGECWAFSGPGRVVIRLFTDVVITGVSLEHIPVALSPSGDLSSAPNNFCLHGLQALDDPKPHQFGTFSYSIKGPPLQTFKVQRSTDIPYSFVEIFFNNNHGNKDFTCVYRVRIHGHLPGEKVKKVC